MIQTLQPLFQARNRLPLQVMLRQFIERQVRSGNQTFRHVPGIIEKLTDLPLVGPYCHVLLGITSASAGRYQEAVSHYQAALDRHVGRQADIIYHQGIAYLGNKDFQAAESCFRGILEPKCHWVYQRLGESLIAQGRLSEAEEILRQGLITSPQAKWLRNAFINCLLKQGRADEGIEELLKAVAQAPADSDLAAIHFPMALLKIASINQQRAATLRGLRKLHPKSIDLQQFVERMEGLLGCYEAEQKLRKALAGKPDDSSLRREIFNSMCMQERGREALDELIAIADAVPTGNGPLPFTSAWYNLTPTMVNPLQIEALSAVVARHPGASEAIIFLARMESLLGRYEAATERFKQAGALIWPDLHGQAENNQPPGKPPSFMIIGQAKAGTTTLYHSLSEHPLFETALIKEPHYWSLNQSAGIDWYRAHFPPIPVTSDCITGEASTSYFHDPSAPQLIAKALPNIKLILVLRDPVERAFSHYWMNMRLGEERRSFELIVKEELAAIPCCPHELSDYDMYWCLNPCSYLLQSTALAPLKRWLSCFPKEQLLIIETSELAKDLPGTLQRVCSFLDLPPFTPDQSSRKNVGLYPPMSPALEQKLRDWFAPHQIALEDYLRDLKFDG